MIDENLTCEELYDFLEKEILTDDKKVEELFSIAEKEKETYEEKINNYKELIIDAIEKEKDIEVLKKWQKIELKDVSRLNDSVQRVKQAAKYRVCEIQYKQRIAHGLSHDELDDFLREMPRMWHNEIIEYYFKFNNIKTEMNWKEKLVFDINNQSKSIEYYFLGKEKINYIDKFKLFSSKIYTIYCVIYFVLLLIDPPRFFVYIVSSGPFIMIVVLLIAHNILIKRMKRKEEWIYIGMIFWFILIIIGIWIVLKY